MAQLDHEQKIRKKFPLPHHMPRVVTIPPYNPLLQNGRNAIIKFVPVPPSATSKVSAKPPSNATTPETNHNTPKTTANAELTLAGVNGVAGRVGLRRGDIITHVNQERVRTFSEYTIAVQYALEQEAPHEPRNITTAAAPAMTITVNATDEIAQQLFVRAQQMQQQNIRFHG